MPHPHDQNDQRGLLPSTGALRAPVITGETARRGRTFLPEQKLTAFENLNRALEDPFGGTGINNIIQQLLESLVPGEEIARRNQADEFRKAGAISDASRAVASSRLETGLQRGRATTAAQGFLQFLGPLLAGRQTALTGIPALREDISETRQFGFPPPVQRFGATSRRAALPTRRTAARAPTPFAFNPTFNLAPSGTAAPALAPNNRLPFVPSGATGFGPQPGGADLPGAGVPGFRGSGTPEDPFTNL